MWLQDYCVGSKSKGLYYVFWQGMIISANYKYSNKRSVGSGTDMCCAVGSLRYDIPKQVFDSHQKMVANVYVNLKKDLNTLSETLL